MAGPERSSYTPRVARSEMVRMPMRGSSFWVAGIAPVEQETRAEQDTRARPAIGGRRTARSALRAGETTPEEREDRAPDQSLEPENNASAFGLGIFYRPVS